MLTQNVNFLVSGAGESSPIRIEESVTEHENDCSPSRSLNHSDDALSSEENGGHETVTNSSPSSTSAITSTVNSNGRSGREVPTTAGTISVTQNHPSTTTDESRTASSPSQFLFSQINQQHVADINAMFEHFFSNGVNPSTTTLHGGISDKEIAMEATNTLRNSPPAAVNQATLLQLSHLLGVQSNNSMLIDHSTAATEGNRSPAMQDKKRVRLMKIAVTHL